MLDLKGLLLGIVVVLISQFAMEQNVALQWLRILRGVAREWQLGVLCQQGHVNWLVFHIVKLEEIKKVVRALRKIDES